MRSRVFAVVLLVMALTVMALAPISMRRTIDLVRFEDARLSLDHGGILYADRAGVPILTGIPVLGDLFRNRLADGGWWFELDLAAPRRVNVPLWFPALVLAGLATWVFARSRRRVGSCERCAYDLTGTPSERCPECGAPIVPV